MKFTSGAEFLDWHPKRLAFVGMSGVGKSTLAGFLNPAHWTTFCTDHQLADRALRPELEAFAGPDFPVSDDDISVLSSYVGKLGREDLGGLPLEEFKRRQGLHAGAERQTFEDLTRDLECHDGPAIIDAGGSLVEVLDFSNEDPLLCKLCEAALFVYIDADRQVETEVVARQLLAPKPMYYRPEFLARAIEDLGAPISQTDPDEFIAYVFPKLMAERRPRYEAIAKAGGVILPFDLANKVRNDEDLLTLIARRIDHAH